MSFLNAALLGALLPLVGLPLLIHLLSRSSRRRFRFSNVKLLKETKAHRSKLYAWRHWILLVIRTLFVLLVLLVFLRPMREKYGGSTGALEARNVVILIDHSLSMEYAGESVSPRRRAILAAEQLIDSLDEGDLVNVILVESGAVPCFAALCPDHAEAKRFVSVIEPGFGAANFSAANGAAVGQFAEQKGRKEIYYISDFQRRNWSDVDFSAIPVEARLVYVPVGGSTPENRGILDAKVGSAALLTGDTVVLDVTVGNFSNQPFDAPVAVILNESAKFERAMQIPPWSVGTVSFPIITPSEGRLSGEVSLPADALPGDDRFYLTLPIMSKEPVLTVCDQTDEDTLAFLQAALSPFDDDRGSLRPEVCASAELDAARLAATRKLFVTKINPLDAPTCARIEAFIFEGGGMIYFLDGDHDTANVETLSGAFDGLPFKVRGKHRMEKVTQGGQQIIRGNFRSPFLRLFKGGLRQNLGLLEFYDFYFAAHTGKGEVLLEYVDETPAMASLSHGLGTVLLMNFSLSELSSNIARQRVFPAWIHDLVKQLTVENPAPASYRVGEPVHARVWKSDIDRRGVETPDGTFAQVDYGNQRTHYSISFVPGRTGFYRFGKTGVRHPYGVNSPAVESDLRPVDRERLPQARAGERPGYFLDSEAAYEHLKHGVPMFHWLLLAACGMAALEMAFQLLVTRVQAQ